MPEKEESDTYIPVNEEEMTLVDYPCGLRAGAIITPIADIPSDEEGGIYLKAGTRCGVLTGNPAEPDIIWFRNCSTGEVATWDDSILDYFTLAPPKPELTEAELPGKTILIGIRRFDRNGNQVSFETHFGTITGVDEHRIIRIDVGREKLFTIPFCPDNLEVADPECLFRTEDGREFTGVDFLSDWTVYPT